MLRLCIPTILLAAQFFFFGYPSSAQSPAASPCPCTLQGSVVDSISGQPVPHALVKLTAPSPRAALTDSAGRFQFEGLPAGSATLEAEKPGFLARDPFGVWYPPSVTILLAPDSPPALLKLVPEGVISGQVSDESGNPLEAFTISIFSRGSGHLGLGLAPDALHRSASTDDEGKFRIAGLHPGSYYLQARQTQGPAPGAARSSVPSGYSPVFYPAAADVASAVPIKVLPGGTVQANFSLKRVPFIRLSGTVSGYTPQEQISLSLADSSGTPQSIEISFEPTNGSFRTKWIPPGVYTLTGQSSGEFVVDGSAALSSALQSSTHVVVGLGPGRMPSATFASLRVNASTSVSDLHLALQPTIDIPVVIRGLSATNNDVQPALPALVLVPKEHSLAGRFVGARPSDSNAQFAGDLHVAFESVVPGRYELKIIPHHDTYYVESATWGSTDLLRNDLVLDSSGSVPPVEVVVHDDGAAINGKVFFDGTPLQSLVVFLTDKRSKPVFFPVGADGTFTIWSLAPGAYHVFAVDGSANFDYEDPASLAKISSKIQEITLAPKQSASLNLELATVGE